MKQEMTFTAGNEVSMVQGIANMYSNMLEQEVSTKQTWCLLNAQAAFVALLLCSCGPLTLTLLSAGWFVSALLKCKAEF